LPHTPHSRSYCIWTLAYVNPPARRADTGLQAGAAIGPALVDGASLPGVSRDATACVIMSGCPGCTKTWVTYAYAPEGRLKVL